MGLKGGRSGNSWLLLVLVAAAGAVLLVQVDRWMSPPQEDSAPSASPAPEAAPAPSGDAPSDDAPEAPRQEPTPVVVAPAPTQFNGDPRTARYVPDARCTPEQAADADDARAELWAHFKRMESRGFTIDSDPAVTPVTTAAILDAITEAERAATPIAGAARNVRPPFIVLYRDAKQMRAASCVQTDSALGHYDGAIHLSADDQHGVASLRETIFHEYMHHLLREKGIRRPLWLQEGLAMLASGETWSLAPGLGLQSALAGAPLSTAELEQVLESSTDSQMLSAAYHQSLMRVRFLKDRLAGGSGGSFEGQLRALAQGELPPNEVFERVLGIGPEQTERQWREFLRTLQANGP